MHLSTWLCRGVYLCVSTCPSLRVPAPAGLVFSCVARACPGAFLWCLHSPSAHQCPTSARTCLCAGGRICVFYTHIPVSTVHGMYGTCEHTHVGVLCLFSWVCVSLVNINISSLFCVLVGICVYICIGFCVPHVSKLHVCRFIFVEPCVWRCCSLLLVSVSPMTSLCALHVPASGCPWQGVHAGPTSPALH